MTDRYELIVVGAGPCGIAVGAAAARAGVSCVLFDRGCITASIGYRSPSPRALAERAVEAIAATLSDHPGYRDTPQTIDADPYRINSAALALARTMCDEIAPDRVTQALGGAFGAHVTEPRQTDLIQCYEAVDSAMLDARISALINDD